MIYTPLVDEILNKCKKDSLVFEEEKSTATLSLVCSARGHVGRFFYDMASRWLIPGRSLQVLLHFSTEFKGESICQIVLHLGKDSGLAKNNFPFLKKEILMGIKSFYQATKILEIKGLNLDDKTALVQDKVSFMVRRFPSLFDYDLFSAMQHFLVRMKESFKIDRGPNELSRVIFTLYRFRKTLVEKKNDRRHVCLKLRKIQVHTAFGQKEVLCVFLGLNFLKKHEVFEKGHLMSALSSLCRGLRAVKGAYFFEKQTFYLEVEKEEFSSQEIKMLKERLPKEIVARIEQLVAPVFMPRNEEEVMRGILALSGQLKYVRDLPQVMISFDEQAVDELCFTVILMRAVFEKSKSVEQLLEKTGLDLSLERIKKVGLLRKKYPKEASVFKVRLPTGSFLREDFSVDLLSARIYLVSKLQNGVGEFRDYNGGMIAKQGENFHELKRLLGKEGERHSLILQNFFHCITPAHLSTTLDPKILGVLFSMLVEAVEKEGPYLQTKKAEDALFVMAKLQDFSLKEEIVKKFPKKGGAKIEIQIFDFLYLGLIDLQGQCREFDFFLEQSHT